MSRLLPLLVFISLCLSAPGFAAPLQGKQLDPAIKSDGKPALGLHYSYASNEDMYWGLRIGTSISHKDIMSLPEIVYWTIYDVEQEAFVTGWEPTNRMNLGLLTGAYEVTKPDKVATILVRMRSMAIVISEDKSVFDFFISVQRLCEQHPSSVVDLTNTLNEKCIVSQDQIPDSRKMCDDERKKLEDWLERELVTCSIANSHLERKGCAKLSCQ